MNPLPSHTYPNALHGADQDDGMADRIAAILADPRTITEWMGGVTAAEEDYLAVSELVSLMITRGLPRMDKADPRDVALVDRYDELADYLQGRVSDWAEREIEREAREWEAGR